MECLLSNDSAKEKSDKGEKEKKKEEKGLEGVVVVGDKDVKVSNQQIILVIMITRWKYFVTKLLHTSLLHLSFLHFFFLFFCFSCFIPVCQSSVAHAPQIFILN